MEEIEETHHFKPLNQGTKIGIFPVVLDEGRLNPFTGTFNVHARPVHLGQIHSLQVPQAPEQHLGIHNRDIY